MTLTIIHGHTQKNLKKWTGKKWYHQRFDGSPYLLHFIAEAEIAKEPRKLDGHNYVHYCFFDNGKADWYIEMVDIKRIYTSVITAGKSNPKISTQFLADWKNDEHEFYEKCIEIGNTNLSELRDTELLALHDDFLHITLRRNSSSSVIDGFALGTDTLIAEKIKVVYETSKLKETMRSTEVFSILTAPVHLSFINHAEVALLKLAVAVKKDPNRKEDLLAEHQKNFFWIRNNYVDANVLDTVYFNEELDKIFSINIDVEEEIKKIEETPQVNKNRKAELMKKLTLDDELKLLIKVSEDFTYWQDERKKATFWTAHYATLILEEIGKRVGISADLLKYASPREIAAVFKKEITQEELTERQKNSVFYWDTEGHECLSGEEAEKVKQTILGTTDLSDVDDFRGLTASMGKATGTVKVLKSAKEVDKVEEGDILVAVMTRPDYVPAMKKAAAIVTDEGGVTCHAAIVSRELGIPCIIGTKIATKVLKDGMQAEVNANHGWVKIVK